MRIETVILSNHGGRKYPVWMGKNKLQSDIQKRIDNGEYATEASQPHTVKNNPQPLEPMNFGYAFQQESSEEMSEDLNENSNALASTHMNIDSESDLEDKDIGSDESMPNAMPSQ